MSTEPETIRLLRLLESWLSKPKRIPLDVQHEMAKSIRRVIGEKKPPAPERGSEEDEEG